MAKPKNLYEWLMNDSYVTKKDVAELHQPTTSEERIEEIVEALQEGYENLPDD